MGRTAGRNWIHRNGDREGGGVVASKLRTEGVATSALGGTRRRALAHDAIETLVPRD